MPAAIRWLLAALLTAPLLGAAAQAAAPPRTIATFSVAAYDPRTGEVGVAVQSKFFAVGSVVPWCKAGVGAVATQAFGQPTYGPRGLELMAKDAMPMSAIMEVLRDDPLKAQRQIGMVAVNANNWEAHVTADRETESKGKLTFTPAPEEVLNTLPEQHGAPGAATWTGDECLNWAGGIANVAPDGVVYAVQGNILTGEEVVKAMAAAMDDPESLTQKLPDRFASTPVAAALAGNDFASRLLGALVAGELAGGDSRGMQSAALKVCQDKAGYGGYNDVKYDLRVDDAPDPFIELGRLLNLGRPIVMANEAYTKLNGGDMPAAIALFEKLVALDPADANNHYNLACALSRSGELDRAMDELKLALAADPKMQQLAQTDTDLTNLHGREDFKALVGEPEAPTPPAGP